MESPIHRHNSVIFNYFALIITDFQLFVVSLHKIGFIIYMNDKSRETYKKEGDLIGKNLYECHSERSKEIIRRLLATGGSNAYTIEKHGVHKVIYQTTWKKDGKVAGIVEISMVTPADMPHYVRG